ncbi:MAG: hypothetical protein DRP08_00465 [Candidatus Aenigmatarchaeota archaeon]|nr:MAG: hypothetical protein DRP08_00465 [Candidatus Aenigmarchaeota archaeon]
MAEMKRLTAIKCNIKDITDGEYIEQEGFVPDYILTKSGQKLSRVRIMATVVNKFVSDNSQYGALTLDDETDTIRAKVFKNISLIEHVEEGDIVDVIGKIRKWNDEIHLIIESVLKIDDPNWLTLRKAELKKQKTEWESIKKIILEKEKETADLDELKKLMKKKYNLDPDQVEAIIISKELGIEKHNVDRRKNKELILKLIEELDEGDGTDYTKLMEAAGLEESDIDSAINELLTDGVCFEPKPGKIKKL